MPNAVLTRLLEQRSEQETFIDQLLERIAQENRDMVDAERSNLNAARERISQLDDQIEPLEAFETTRSAHRDRASQVTPTRPLGEQRSDQPRRGEGQRLGLTEREEQPYRSAGEFMADYVRSLRFPGHDHHEPDERAVSRVRAARGVQSRAAGDVAPGPHQTTTDTPGLLPVNIVGAILNDLDGARPFIASVGARAFTPGAGKTWQRPVVEQHTLVGEQTREKAELPSRELTIDTIDFVKRTFGGHVNVSRQAIDWTSPSAWDAVVNDLQVQYGLHTEDTYAALFAAGVGQSVSIAAADEDDVAAWIRALYAASTVATTANGTKRASSLRLPDRIWVSPDVDAQLGAMLAIARIAAQNPAGTSTVNAFGGNLLDLPRVMVPGFPEGTAIIGRTSMYEYYEERIGLLSAVEPKVFGVDVAYGGYAAGNFLDATAFAKIAVASTVA